MGLPTWASVLIALGTVAAVTCTVDFLLSRFLRVPLKPAGKHCFITGGSTGLGKALAMQLAAAGADVCIVARRESELKKAAEEIEVSEMKSIYPC